jgi:ferredoxin--NADP+ reductase
MSIRSRRSHEGIPLNLYRISSPGIAHVLSNERLTPWGCDDVRHIVLDLSGLDYPYREGQSLGVLPPGVDQRGHAQKLRLYSIASSRRGDDGRGTTASLCVKRVVYSDPVTTQEHRGVASNYLCDLKPGDEVNITGPDGTHFLLPDDPTTSLILVATGTGIAPFRGFLRRIYRERDDWTGAVYLFFGVRTEVECLYRDEFDSYLDRHRYCRSYAFSREQKTADGRRMYVQHRMAERIGELRDLLERDSTILYICGVKGMEDGIEATLKERARSGGKSWTSFHDLRRAGRILVETY